LDLTYNFFVDVATNIAATATPQQQNIVVTQAQPVQQPQVIYVTAQQPTIMPPQQTLVYAQPM